MSLASRYAFPLTIAAAVLCLAYAITIGVMSMLDPRPGAVMTAVGCACLAVFWTGCAVWVRHEQRKQQPR